MSKQRQQLALGARELAKARKAQQALPIKEKEIIVYPSNIRSRLLQFGLLPERVIDLILQTTYNDPLTGRAELLFPESQDIFTQLEEIVRVYDLIRGLNVQTGREKEVQIPVTNITEDEAFEIFSDHMKTLVQIRERKLAKVDVRFPLIRPDDSIVETMKIRQTLVIKDDTVFDAPALAELRKQELIKISLITRKKKPVPGKCPRCGHGLILMEEKFVRSGDEGGVIFRQCHACEYEWH
jgi:DNA-directed RNA polymerase subunit M/transcription elongation factor TFIIS/Fe2+ transport system protein FeoA